MTCNTECILIDTPGFVFNSKNINNFIMLQIWESINDSDLILLVFDSSIIFNKINLLIVRELRKFKKKIILIVNKIDTISKELKLKYIKVFFNLDNIIYLSSKYNRNIDKLISYLFNKIQYYNMSKYYVNENKIIKIAVIGKTNVGKSTLINKVLNQDRSIVNHISGTTTDHVYSKIKYNNNEYMFIDTPGIIYEKKIYIFESIIVKLFEFIQTVDIIMIVVHSKFGISRKDIMLIKYIWNLGKKMILIFNKCDLLLINEKKYIINFIKEKLSFMKYIKYIFMSSLYDKNCNILFYLINKIHKSIYKQYSISNLNKRLRILFTENSFYTKKNIKLKHIYIIDYNPLKVAICGLNTDLLSDFQKKNIINSLNKLFNVIGFGIKVKFKNLNNPYILNM